VGHDAKIIGADAVNFGVVDPPGHSSVKDPFKVAVLNPAAHEQTLFVPKAVA